MLSSLTFNRYETVFGFPLSSSHHSTNYWFGQKFQFNQPRTKTKSVGVSISIKSHYICKWLIFRLNKKYSKGRRKLPETDSFLTNCCQDSRALIAIYFAMRMCKRETEKKRHKYKYLSIVISQSMYNSIKHLTSNLTRYTQTPHICFCISPLSQSIIRYSFFSFVI